MRFFPYLCRQKEKNYGRQVTDIDAISFYDLDVIISVGYRVHSRQGTQFRIWATQRLWDWVEKLRIVLTMNQQSVLEDAGRISHTLALQKASVEYEKYKAKQLDAEHLASIKELEQDLKNACPKSN